MLIEFSVENFKSFKEIAILSMVAAKLRSKNKDIDQSNVFDGPGAPPLLSSAAIYGANASGKSNLVAAIDFMRKFVLDSTKETRSTGAIDVESFRLSATTLNKPSHFEIVFVLGGLRYRYGFEVTKERVVEEWLFYVPRTREARLFERFDDDIKLGDAFKEGKGLEGRTRPNALFLSVVAQFNGQTAQKLVKWFRGIGVISGVEDSAILPYTMRRFVKGDSVSDMSEFIQRLDLGIHDVAVEKSVLNVETLSDDMPEEFRSIAQSLQEFMARNDVEIYAAKTYHPIFDENGVQIGQEVFDLESHESEGTKKLFALTGPLFDTLKQGNLLVIDELDARMHPLLTREIVSIFNNPRTNPLHAQLVFTTQDTNLLDNQFLRRDQIWFTEKDRQGASILYSLAEFKVRNDATYEQDYIKGRYGAVPFLGGLRQTVEQA